MISEDWSNVCCKFSFTTTRINYILKYVETEKKYIYIYFLLYIVWEAIIIALLHYYFPETKFIIFKRNIHGNTVYDKAVSGLVARKRNIEDLDF